jgi:hypothetical protein
MKLKSVEDEKEKDVIFILFFDLGSDLFVPLVLTKLAQTVKYRSRFRSIAFI